MSTLTNYEGLLALSTSPHLSQTMRDYLVSVLSEHRMLHAALQAARIEIRNPGAASLGGVDINHMIDAALSKVGGDI